MSSDEIGYYRVRCKAERTLAASSSDPAVAAIHEKMAELYEKLTEIEQNENRVIPITRAGSA